MVPIRDDNPTRITPYVTYGLIAVNVLIFIYELFLQNQVLGFRDTPRGALPVTGLDFFFETWAVVPCQLSTTCPITSPTAVGLPEWVTLFSSQFLHGGFLHLAGNMLYLWIFGNNVEDRLGHLKYLVFYLACGALAALTQWFFSPNSTIPSLGASGAIAGVMGAYILRFPQAKILTLVPLGFLLFPFRIPAVFFLGFWFVMQALNGVAGLNAPTNIGNEGGIAFWAHTGGFVFGAILGPLLGLFNRDP